jgi:hypothetical protein
MANHRKSEDSNLNGVSRPLMESWPAFAAVCGPFKRLHGVRRQGVARAFPELPAFAGADSNRRLLPYGRRSDQWTPAGIRRARSVTTRGGETIARPLSDGAGDGNRTRRESNPPAWSSAGIRHKHTIGRGDEGCRDNRRRSGACVRRQGFTVVPTAFPPASGRSPPTGRRPGDEDRERDPHLGYDAGRCDCTLHGIRRVGVRPDRSFGYGDEGVRERASGAAAEGVSPHAAPIFGGWTPARHSPWIPTGRTRGGRDNAAEAAPRVRPVARPTFGVMMEFRPHSSRPGPGARFPGPPAPSRQSTIRSISSTQRSAPDPSAAKAAIASNTASEKPPTLRMSARSCPCVVA